MRKILSSIPLALLPFAIAPQAFAQQNLNPCAQMPAPFNNLCGIDNIGNVIGFVVVIAFVIAIIIALLFLVWGGIKWITSGGDKAGVEAARNQIIAAIIGLIIVFLAFFILNLVLGLFGISLFNLQLPTINDFK